MPALSWAAASNKAQPPKALSQSGVIRLNGCVVSPGSLALTATPMQLGAVVDTDVDDVAVPDAFDIDPKSSVRHVRRAHIRATNDPHIFNFVFHALKVTKLYTLNIQVASSACGRMTWIGPARGVIAPGRQSSVPLNGYALTTQIDVESTDTNGSTIFRGADALDNDNMLRRVRWHSDLAGVTDVELQIAADRFPSATETTASCGNPPGLLTKVRLASTSGTNLSPLIDFGLVLPDAGHEGTLGEVEFTETISDATRFAFENGAPLYVRAIPLRADGTRLCNLLNHGAAGMAILARKTTFIATLLGQSSLGVNGSYSPARPVAPYDHCVSAIKPHLAATSLWNGLTLNPDWLGYYFRAAGQVDGNGWVQPGAFVCWNNSTSVIDDVGNFVTGFVDAIASIVNFIADLYNNIKQQVVELVADAISVLPGITCEEVCKDLVNAAMSTALTAMGMPPSLPNFDALVNDGVDYVKGLVAEQTGLPGFAVDAVTDKVIELASQETGGGGGLPDWVVKDNGFRPARVVLDLDPNPLKLGLVPDHLKIHTDPAGLYPDISLPLPAAMRNEGRSFRVPVQLPPDLSNTANAPCPPFAGGSDCNSAWPPELVLKIKLADWYAHRFAPASCSQITFNGERGYSAPELLGTRAVVPQDEAALGAADMICD